jgi:hypothetical protein
MKFVSISAVLGLASLVAGCTIPADWNRSDSKRSNRCQITIEVVF